MSEKERFESAVQILGQIRDLSDFCAQWEALRPLVEPSLLDKNAVPKPTIETIAWLARLADQATKVPLDGRHANL